TLLDHRVVPLWAEHATRRADEKIRSSVGETLHHFGKATVGANQDTNLAVGTFGHGRLGAGSIPDGFVIDPLLVILANELAARVDGNRGVVAGFAIRLEHAGDEEDF